MSSGGAPDSLPAVILAGGLATRMGGGDKPLRLLRGRPLLDHVLGRLRPQTGPIALNANGPLERFAAWGLPVVADVLPGYLGPLSGVLAALRWAVHAIPQADFVLTVPCDTPFLPPDMAKRLVGSAGSGRIVQACSDGRLHHTIAVWPLGLEPVLHAALLAGERRLGEWAARQGAISVSFESRAGDPFANINTPDDLARAEAELR